MTAAVDIACQYWLSLVNEPIGMGLVVSDPFTAKTQLYQARRKLTEKGFLGLDQFTIRTSPVNPATELWIFRAQPQPAGNTPDASTSVPPGNEA